MAVDDIPKKISLYTKVKSNFELPWGLVIYTPSRKERKSIISLNCLNCLSPISFSSSFQSLVKRRITADSTCWYHFTGAPLLVTKGNVIIYGRGEQKRHWPESQRWVLVPAWPLSSWVALDMCHPLSNISLPSINSSSTWTRSSNPFSSDILWINEIT